MKTPASVPARKLALKLLNTLNLKKQTARQLLDEHLASAKNPAHTTDLVLGVIRNRKTLDHLIARLTDRRVDRINPSLINILRIGAYELFYCSETPDYAIVNEAVELVPNGSKKQTGFVNACLQSLKRGISKRTAPRKKFTARTLPTAPGHCCLFKNDVLCDPGRLEKFLSEAFSLPLWLVKSWQSAYGPEAATAACYASNRRPSLYLYPNTLRIDLENLADIFTKSDIRIETPEAEGTPIRLLSHIPVDRLPGYAEGLFYIQDPSAAKVAQVLAPVPDTTVLDLCAAPGTKTLQMGLMMHNQGTLTATDINPARIEKIRDNCRRLGLENVAVKTYIEFQTGFTERLFDIVLVDAPCSNTGVMARRPEVRHRLTPKGMESITKTQLEMLIRAANFTRPESRLCYSTCSIQPEENENLIEHFLRIRRDFTLETQVTTLPEPGPDNLDHDGGFFAVLLRT